MELVIPNRLSALANPQRLAVFRLLMRRYPDRIPATEIARALDLKPNTLSSYVNALMQAGLVTQERSGTSLRYAVDIDSTRETVDYLMFDCCRGRPDLCSPSSWPASYRPDAAVTQKHNVLFICTGNSTRSIFAEAILRKIAGDRFVAYSAGTASQSKINPFALDVLVQNGHEVADLEAKNITVFQNEDAPRFDFVFTVCNQAANEECPAWAGQPINAHWGIPDPVKAEGTKAQKTLAFHQAYGALYNRIQAFVSLPLTTLDRISLQRAMDDIGQSTQGDTE